VEAAIEIGEIGAERVSLIGSVVGRAFEVEVGANKTAKETGNDAVAAQRSGNDTVKSALETLDVLAEVDAHGRVVPRLLAIAAQP